MKLALTLAAAAAALTIASTPAIADSVKKEATYSATPIAYTQSSDEIVVRPYGIVREHTGRRTSIGAREEIVSLSEVVSVRDLNLRYNADVGELHRRISYTASEICRDLDRATFGESLTSDRECVRDAVRDARGQADAMVARARY